MPTAMGQSVHAISVECTAGEGGADHPIHLTSESVAQNVEIRCCHIQDDGQPLCGTPFLVHFLPEPLVSSGLAFGLAFLLLLHRLRR